MITKSTVLILGAGASADYGFPVGRELLINVCNGLKPGENLFTFFTGEIGIPQDHIERFRDALEDSHAPSVDFFIEQNKEFEEIGKLAIAATLIPCEKYDAFRLTEKPSWYETLFHRMIQGGRFEEKRLYILTFNYDRSLEAFFFKALKRYHLMPDAIQKELNKRVIHLYGSLGDQLIPGDGERGYQPVVTPEWVEKAAKRIRIVHEEHPGQELERAYSILNRAGRVLLLGFGFNPVNIQRLRLNNERIARGQEHPCEWFASRKGMGEGEITRVKEDLKGIPYIQFAPDQNWGINDFLKNVDCLGPDSPDGPPPTVESDFNPRDLRF